MVVGEKRTGATETIKLTKPIGIVLLDETWRNYRRYTSVEVGGLKPILEVLLNQTPCYSQPGLPGMRWM
jgi:hypothetical protein